MPPPDPVKYSRDIADGYAIQVRGEDNDVITFALNGTVIAYDQIKDGNDLQLGGLYGRKYIANNGSPIYFINIPHGTNLDLIYVYAITSDNIVTRSNKWADVRVNHVQEGWLSDAYFNDNKTATVNSGGGMNKAFDRGVLTFDESNRVWNYAPYDPGYLYTPGPPTFGQGYYY